MSTLPREFTESLPVELSNDEYDTAAGALGTLDAEISAKKKQHSAAMKALNTRKDALLETMRTRTERREVECVERIDGNGMVEKVRLDTNVQIEPARKATDDELQIQFKGTGEKQRRTTVGGDEGSGDEGSEFETHDAFVKASKKVPPTAMRAVMQRHLPDGEVSTKASKPDMVTVGLACSPNVLKRITADLVAEGGAS